MATTETRGKERARERERERAKREADREGEGESNARATRATEETRETSRTHPVVCIVRKLSACYSTSYTVSYHLSPMPIAFRPTLCTPPALQYVAREETDRAKVCHQGKRKRDVPGRTRLVARAMVGCLSLRVCLSSIRSGTCRAKCIPHTH